MKDINLNLRAVRCLNCGKVNNNTSFCNKQCASEHFKKKIDGLNKFEVKCCSSCKFISEEKHITYTHDICSLYEMEQDREGQDYKFIINNKESFYCCYYEAKENKGFCKKEACKHFSGGCDSPVPIIGCKLREESDIQMFSNGIECGDYEAKEDINPKYEGETAKTVTDIINFTYEHDYLFFDYFAEDSQLNKVLLKLKSLVKNNKSEPKMWLHTYKSIRRCQTLNVMYTLHQYLTETKDIYLIDGMEHIKTEPWHD